MSYELSVSFGSEIFHTNDKEIHDLGSSLPRPFDIQGFADSTDSVQRAIYYLGVSEGERVPLWLSAEKLAFLDTLGRIGVRIGCVEDPNELLCEAVLPPEYRDPQAALFPIVELVVRHAFEERVSLMQAALAVRDSAEARSYRRQMFELRAGMAGATHASVNDAKKYLERMRGLAKVWRSDPYDGIKYIHQASKVDGILKLIPKVGTLLSLLTSNGLTKFLGKRLDRPDPVHMFVSRWFRPDREKLEDLVKVR